MDNLRNLAMKYDADGKEISGIADSGAMMTPVPEGSAAGETMMVFSDNLRRRFLCYRKLLCNVPIT